MAWLERLGGSEVAIWETWEGSEMASQERWESSKVARWEVSCFVYRWEMQGETKISSFYF